MPRIFSGLVAGNLVLVVAAAALGFVDPAPTPDRHVLLAVVALLFTCLIQVLAFTYLIVTGKVITQAVHLGRLDAGLLAQAKDLKRRLLRTLGLLVLAVVIVTATGAAAWRSGDPRTYHLPATLFFLTAHVWACVRQWEVVAHNARLLQATLDAYNERRHALRSG